MPPSTGEARPGSRRGAARGRRPNDPGLLSLSVALQLALAALFGHSYDMRVALAAGYLTARGRSPYEWQDLTAALGHPGFDIPTTIGYPPPWPLVLGLVQRVTDALTPEFFAYHLAAKLPVIAATVGLAYLVAAVARWAGAQKPACRRAWVFILFNPFILYTGAAWGQIDVIVALAALGSLALLWSGRWAASAGLLALAVCTKPVPLPTALVGVLYLARQSARVAVAWSALFGATSVLLAVLPFAVFGWDAGLVLRNWNAHFAMTGSMSLMTVAELAGAPEDPGGLWWLLGLAWVPALALAAALMRRGDDGLLDLVRQSAGLTLVFLLTRTWLAEPNVVVVLPLAVILAATEALDRRAVTALWTIPLAFTVVNISPLQLLWATFPGAMDEALTWLAGTHTLRLALKSVFVVAWQAAGWWVAVGCLRGGRGEPAPAARRERGSHAGAVAGTEVPEPGAHEVAT